jgi:hypothetical protein
VVAEGSTRMADSPMDYRQHEQTYALFLGLAKYGTIAVAIILVLMAIFLL